MKVALVSTAYIPGRSVLHRLHPTAKLVLLLVYTMLIAFRPTPIFLLGLELCLILVMWGMGLPIPHRWLGLVVAGLLVMAILSLPDAGWLRQLVVGMGRVVCLLLLVSLFGMVTRANDLLPVGNRRWLYNIAFVVSLTTATLPGVQYDLQRAIDTETLRRRKAISPFNIGAWLGLLPRLIVRGLARADRLADAAFDRGFAPGRILTPLYRTHFGWADLAQTAVCLLPALSLLVLSS